MNAHELKPEKKSKMQLAAAASQRNTVLKLKICIEFSNKQHISKRTHGVLKTYPRDSVLHDRPRKIVQSRKIDSHHLDHISEQSNNFKCGVFSSSWSALNQ